MCDVDIHRLHTIMVPYGSGGAECITSVRSQRNHESNGDEMGIHSELVV